MSDKPTSKWEQLVEATRARDAARGHRTPSPPAPIAEPQPAHPAQMKLL